MRSSAAALDRRRLALLATVLVAAALVLVWCFALPSTVGTPAEGGDRREAPQDVRLARPLDGTLAGAAGPDARAERVTLEASLGIESLLVGRVVFSKFKDGERESAPLPGLAVELHPVGAGDVLHATTDEASEIRVPVAALRYAPYDVLVSGAGLGNQDLRPVRWDGDAPVVVGVGAVTCAALLVERSDGSPRPDPRAFSCSTWRASGHLVVRWDRQVGRPEPTGTCLADELLPLERRLLELVGLPEELDLRGAAIFVTVAMDGEPDFYERTATVCDIDTAPADFRVVAARPEQARVERVVLEVLPTTFGEVVVAFEPGGPPEKYELLDRVRITAEWRGEEATLPLAVVRPERTPQDWTEGARIRLPVGRWRVGVSLSGRRMIEIAEVRASSAERLVFPLPTAAGLRFIRGEDAEHVVRARLFEGEGRITTTGELEGAAPLVVVAPANYTVHVRAPDGSAWWTPQADLGREHGELGDRLAQDPEFRLAVVNRRWSRGATDAEVAELERAIEWLSFELADGEILELHPFVGAGD